MISAVRTTRIFCVPGCPARPKPENVQRFTDPGAALVAGYRPCLRCRPLDAPGLPVPDRSAPRVHLSVVSTPLGDMVAAATGGELLMLEFADRRMLWTQLRRLSKAVRGTWTMDPLPLLARLERQLAEYFSGRRRAFAIPLRAPGTAFQQRVWRQLGRIPAGATRSYGAVARAVGRPTAVRAVARANGDNRIAIVIPCHRVVGSDGSLTGYSGGLWRKKRLLDLERRIGG